jgi:hypothetical protein
MGAFIFLTRNILNTYLIKLHLGVKLAGKDLKPVFIGIYETDKIVTVLVSGDLECTILDLRCSSKRSRHFGVTHRFQLRGRRVSQANRESVLLVVTAMKTARLKPIRMSSCIAGSLFAFDGGVRISKMSAICTPHPTPSH